MINAIEFRNVTFCYKKNKITLNNVNIEINKGDFHALIGPNGAGKSTIIKLINRMNLLQSGTIKINDILIDTNQYKNRNISYIPDVTRFPIGISTFNYLFNESSLFYKDTKVLKIEIDNLLKQFNLESIRNKNPNRLSAGQKKKVELIRIILENPDILILDEPAANLDPYARKDLFNCLKTMNENGTTILISSHIIQEIKLFVNSATLINEGQIKFNGKVSEDKLATIFDHEVNGTLAEYLKQEAELELQNSIIENEINNQQLQNMETVIDYDQYILKDDNIFNNFKINYFDDYYVEKTYFYSFEFNTFINNYDIKNNFVQEIKIKRNKNNKINKSNNKKKNYYDFKILEHWAQQQEYKIEKSKESKRKKKISLKDAFDPKYL